MPLYLPADPAGTAAAAVSTHEADTSSVHGITNTSTLYRSGGTDVAIADGGTGASTAAAALTALGGKTLTGDRISLGAGTLVSCQGSPTLATSTNTPYWRLDDGSSVGLEGAGDGFTVPPGWTTVDISFVWFNFTTDAGDVRLQVFAGMLADGVSHANYNIDTQVTATASSQNLIVRTTVASGFAVTPGRWMAVAGCRRGADAADTKTGDIGLLSVEIVRAS